MKFFRSWLRSWLVRLVNPPRYQSPFFVVESLHLTRAYSVVAELGIADLLAQRPYGIEELALAAGADARSLFRILRTLSAFGVFAQDRRGRFQMTRRARPLLSDGPQSLRSWLILMGRRELWHGFAHTLDGVKSGIPPFELAHGASFYDYLRAHPDLGEVFARALTNWTAWHASEVVKAYDFGHFHSLVDVGGGTGSFLECVLRNNPRLHGILFDQPETIRMAHPRFAAAGLLDRVQLIGGDFSEGIPAGADAYVLKHVLYDWENPSAARILQHCHRAMSADSTLLVIEGIVDPRNGVNRITKLLDLEMGALLRGGHRSRIETQTLLETAGFRLSTVHETAVADLQILEAKKTAVTSRVDGIATSLVPIAHGRTLPSRTRSKPPGSIPA